MRGEKKEGDPSDLQISACLALSRAISPIITSQYSKTPHINIQRMLPSSPFIADTHDSLARELAAHQPKRFSLR
jgi:hypothetical protein